MTKKLANTADALDAGGLSPAAYREAVDKNNLFDVNRGITLGRTRAQPLREPPITPRHRLVGKTAEELAKQIKRIASDPVELAAFMADSRRTPPASKARWGIAQRATTREPMLNANPRQVREALEGRPKLSRIISAGVVESLVVKPNQLRSAKIGRQSAFWGERLWNIHRPKYGPGYFITDDFGNQSRVYPTMGEVHSAIRKAGFNIIRR